MQQLPIFDGSFDNPVAQRGISEQAVRERYAAASRAVEPALCCAVSYDQTLLEAIPADVLERDYGCGDPTPYVRLGDTVLDLGSGGGKLCFIAAQLVGPKGRVIGVDFNPAMMELAISAQPIVSERIGYNNVEFRYGRIQDLKLDLNLLEQRLSSSPVSSAIDFVNLIDLQDHLRATKPLIEDASIDCVLSNCVLNLVRSVDRRQLFDEIYRVLKPGGRVAISDIVCDQSVPLHLQNDPVLWSGCISGAFREDEFLEAFEQAGFEAIEIVKRQPEPWQVVEGIEFRSITIHAVKGFDGPELECNQAVIYRGPFHTVADDQGRLFYRGRPMAVSQKTFQSLQAPAYHDMFYFLPATNPIDPSKAFAFQFDDPTIRDSQLIKFSDAPRQIQELIPSSKDSASCCGGNGATKCC